MKTKIETPEHYKDKCMVCGEWLSIDNPMEYFEPAFINGKEQIIGRCCMGNFDIVFGEHGTEVTPKAK